jgi:putative ABC transport system permease protein
MRTAVAVAILVALTVVTLRAVKAPRGWSAAYAVLRCAVQLTVLSLVLGGIISDARWVALFAAVMFAVACWTAVGRLGLTDRRASWVMGAMAAGAMVALTVVFSTGAVDREARYVLAVCGIVIGGTMTTATLAGRRLVAGLNDRWDEVEGWLALGATPRESTVVIAREAVAEALIPSMDQTRTTGLVTLPGAFVGAIFGGASPLDAGRFQLVVLAAILAAGAVTGSVLTWGLSPVKEKPQAL